MHMPIRRARERMRQNFNTISLQTLRARYIKTFTLLEIRNCKLEISYMKRVILLMLLCGASFGQEHRFITPPNQVVAIRAGRLFDSRTGAILSNQIILIRGDRIADVGGSVQIPREARVIDLTNATVMPGMIDDHVHVNTGGDTPAQRAITAVANAQTDLQAGFTTVADMDSRGGFNT